MHIMGDIQRLIQYVDTIEGSGTIDRRPIPLARLRRERGWSRYRLATELEKIAHNCRYTLPDRPILLSMLSGWESGLVPDIFYRELLRSVFIQTAETTTRHETATA